MAYLPLIFSLTHIEKMSDAVGILEHCIFSTPDRREGYATDDNARALQLMLRLKKNASLYLQFLIFACDPKGFHQDLNANLTWKDEAGVHDGFGRTMAALGEATVTALSDDQKLTATFVFDQQTTLIQNVPYNRTKALLITAISQRMKFEDENSNLVPMLIMRKKLKGDMPAELPINLRTELIRFADEMLIAYRTHSTSSWKWYENALTYDNGRLPLGMLCAYQETEDKKYLEIALESLDFLLAKTFDNIHDCFSFPGYRGWFHKDKEKAIFGQQPIEAGSTVEVCVFAYEVTQNEKYLDYAKKALEWYSGRNILKTNLLNPISGGVRDGLEEWGINPNEGAESILSYALACQALNQVNR